MALDVLVLRALGLGDLLTAVPALRALQKHCDGGRVGLAAPRALAGLVALTGCEHVPARPLRHLPAAARGAQLAVNLHGRGPQSHVIALATRPRALIAFHHPLIPSTAHEPRWRADEHEVARWCRLLEESGIPADPSRLGLPTTPLPEPPPGTHGATVIHPGAASGARRWPAERFGAVAAALDGPVVVTGSTDERALAERVIASSGRTDIINMTGRTDLLALAALVAAARQVVCGDTGVAHLATAFATSSVVLFGPTSPERWGPPPDGPHRALWAGETGDPHGAAPHPGLLAIAPDDVLAAFDPVPFPARSPA